MTMPGIYMLDTQVMLSRCILTDTRNTSILPVSLICVYTKNKHNSYNINIVNEMLMNLKGVLFDKTVDVENKHAQ